MMSIKNTVTDFDAIHVGGLIGPFGFLWTYHVICLQILRKVPYNSKERSIALP